MMKQSLRFPLYELVARILLDGTKGDNLNKFGISKSIIIKNAYKLNIKNRIL